MKKFIFALITMGFLVALCMSLGREVGRETKRSGSWQLDAARELDRQVQEMNKADEMLRREQDEKAAIQRKQRLEQSRKEMEAFREERRRAWGGKIPWETEPLDKK